MDKHLIVVGRVAGPYGIKGWFKVKSFTQPPGNILLYSPWYLDKEGQLNKPAKIKGSQQGKSLIAKIDDIDDRDSAAQLSGVDILVERSAFAPTDEKEYYWRDLLGLTVNTTEGVTLGTVESLMETGANDVLVLQGERRRLIPFIVDKVVNKVDLDAGTIVVSWDPDF